MRFARTEGMRTSCVVTGGGRGIGRAVVERLIRDDVGVVAVELDPETLAWAADHEHLVAVTGSAADPAVTEEAADRAEAMAPLTGWVNNAAVFRDASLHDTDAATVLELVGANLAPPLTGCTTAIRRFLAAGRPGAIVNLSSHQARQSVPGATPYATAKAAIEGLTRALAVEYGPRGIRVNVVAPGSVRTERWDAYLAGLDDPAAVEREMARIQPLGRVAEAEEVAGAVAYLLGNDASFVNGVTLPVDGGRTVRAHDPEERATS